MQGNAGQLFGFKKCLHRCELVGLDIDNETVRRIGGQAGMPIFKQIATHHGEQQQGKHAQCKRGNLDYAAARTATQVEQALTCAVLHAHAQPARRQHQRPGQQCRYQQGGANARQHP